jgi:hypothetical protein
MQENVYQVQWILDPGDPGRAGLYGTTSHHGTTPAAAAIASAELLAHTVAQSGGRPQLLIVSVSEKLSDRNLLSGSDLQAALRFTQEQLPIDVVYRPLC